MPSGDWPEVQQKKCGGGKATTDRKILAVHCSQITRPAGFDIGVIVASLCSSKVLAGVIAIIRRTHLVFEQKFWQNKTKGEELLKELCNIY